VTGSDARRQAGGNATATLVRSLRRRRVAHALRAFLTSGIAHVDRRLARHALASPEIKRLMTIPGVGVTTAATLIAAIGDIHRFPSAKRLVGYLGIDPRLRQSGQSPARQGRISKQGSSACRHVLVEAAWSAIKTRGPLRAFYQRTRARRGEQIAIVATARKLAALCWQLLSTEQDYAFKRQSIVDRKLRQLELRTGATTRHGTQHQPGATTIKQRALLGRQLTPGGSWLTDDRPCLGCRRWTFLTVRRGCPVKCVGGFLGSLG